EAASVAKRGAVALTNWLSNPKNETQTIFSGLSDPLATFVAYMDPNDIASVADGLINALENWDEADALPLRRLSEALAILATRMNPNVATSAATRLVEALEKQEKTEAERLSTFGRALAAISVHMNTSNAPLVRVRGAIILTTALQGLQQTDSQGLS